MRVAIIGTGYVGLVTGTCLAEIGHDVVCMDIVEEKVLSLQKGHVAIYEPGLAELVNKNQEAKRLRFTSSLKDISGAAIVFFALPTPPGAGGEADLSFVLSAAKDVAHIIDDYTVLVNKSTVPIGTSQKIKELVSAETKTSFDVVSNPEFLREGSAVSDFLNPDRIVVGSSSNKARTVMEELYQPFTNKGVKLLLMDEASAEMTKYAANSFLATKISFMNEIANLCERVGANVDFVREGIGTDERIGSRFLYAGIGYGGSCFPKDVMALHRLSIAQDYDFKILSAVMEVNAEQKKVLLHKIAAHYGKDLSGKTFALWGLAFKADTDDIREAPSLEIIQELLDCGAKIQAFDPEAMANTKRIFPDISYAANEAETLKGADALIVVTEWREFIASDLQVIANQLKDKIVFDGRNIFDPETMRATGLSYVSIGRGDV
jgi:UDPglucose 6-dehydrogenase